MQKLREAVNSGNLDKVRALTEDKDYMRNTRFDDSALISAIKRNYDDIATGLIEANAYLIPPSTHHYLQDPPLGGTKIRTDDEYMMDTQNGQCVSWNYPNTNPLIEAARLGKKTLVEKLLENGYNAFINHEDADGNTALLVAAYRGHQDVVNLLINANANVYHINNHNGSALFRAVYQNHSNIIAMVLDALTDVDHLSAELIRVALLGNQAVVIKLLEKGANVAHVNGNGDTALIVAAQSLQPDIVNLIIAAGADINSALMRVVWDGQEDAMKLLIAAGADINYRDRVGKTVLGIAMYKEHFPISKILLAEGADVKLTLEGMSGARQKKMERVLRAYNLVTPQHMENVLRELTPKTQEETDQRSVKKNSSGLKSNGLFSSNGSSVHNDTPSLEQENETTPGPS